VIIEQGIEDSLDAWKKSYDWEQAFECAMRDAPTGVPGYTGSVECFAMEDVAEVIASADGDNDGPAWIGFFRLKDGRFATLSAWCDYTGWG
jgi:hypothetical protein